MDGTELFRGRWCDAYLKSVLKSVDVIARRSNTIPPTLPHSPPNPFPPRVCLPAPPLWEGRSKADPLELMERIKGEGCKDDICVNDLEAPAFSELPELLELKNKLKAAGEGGGVESVFMSGSGSTIVQA